MGVERSGFGRSAIAEPSVKRLRLPPVDPVQSRGFSRGHGRPGAVAADYSAFRGAVNGLGEGFVGASATVPTDPVTPAVITTSE